MDESNTKTTEQIVSLLRSHCYNTSMISTFEEYLILICKKDVPYMFDAVRALIKLYSLFPNHHIITAASAAAPDGATGSSKTKMMDNIGLCCLLALTYGSNDNDIIALQYMIPAAYITKEKEPCITALSQIYHCATLYDTSLFETFWTYYHQYFITSVSETTKSAFITEYDTIMKQVALDTIPILQTSILIRLSITYQQIAIPMICKALNVSSTNTNSKDDTQLLLTTIVKQNPTIIQSIDDHSVTFQANRENTERPRIYQENIHYSTIAQLRHFPSVSQ